MCSSVFEDSACTPKEEKLLCYQCGVIHTVHRSDFLTGVFVTADPEMFHACVPQNDRDGIHIFRDKLINSGVTLCKFVHIEMILISDGGVFFCLFFLPSHVKILIPL